MRSKIFQEILDETPEDVEIFVRLYADLVVRINQLLLENNISKKLSHFSGSAVNCTGKINAAATMPQMWARSRQAAHEMPLLWRTHRSPALRPITVAADSSG